MTRTIQHGHRNDYASPGASGLSQELPDAAVREGQRKALEPGDIDDER